MSDDIGTSHPALVAWNELDAQEAAEAILPCCGSVVWAEKLAGRRPFADEPSLLRASRHVWQSLPETDWQQAFNTHPRIGERKAQSTATPQALSWSAAEQSAAMAAEEADKAALRHANQLYEERFGRIFIICARGRTNPDILSELTRRLANAREAELHEASEQQAEITELRLKQWLAPPLAQQEAVPRRAVETRR